MEGEACGKRHCQHSRAQHAKHIKLFLTDPAVCLDGTHETAFSPGNSLLFSYFEGGEAAALLLELQLPSWGTTDSAAAFCPVQALFSRGVSL